MPARSKALLLFLFSMVLLPNCYDSDDSADNSTTAADVEVSPEDTDNGTCLYRTTPLDSLEAVSENVGYSGADLVTLFEGKQLHQAFYATENDIVEQSPLGGDTIVFLDVEYTGGEIRDIEGKFPSCGHYLEIDVDIAIRTSDTAFAEETTGVLYFYRNEVESVFDVQLYTALDPEALLGHFEIERILQPPSADRVTLHLIETIGEEGVYQGSVVAETGDDSVADSSSQYYQYVLNWQTALLL